MRKANPLSKKLQIAMFILGLIFLGTFFFQQIHQSMLASTLLVGETLPAQGLTPPLNSVIEKKQVVDLPVIAVTHNLIAGEKIGLPSRIIIPSISIDANIEEVALTKNGSMGIPKLPLNTAWYDLGPRPGETGSAVISGHVNWWYGASGSFANLYKLKPGDQITVQDDKGAVISFVVRESRKYQASADATAVFISKDGKAHLNLITCAGVWNKSAQQYSQRLVVFADRV